MGRKKRDQDSASKPPSSKQDSEGFFRPFSNLPKPKPAPQTPPQPAAPPKPAPAPKPARPKTQIPTEDDLLTFDRLMGGVTPLENRSARRVPTSGVRPRADREQEIQQTLAHEQQLELQARSRFRALVDEGSSFEIFDDGRMVDGRRRGVDGGTVRKMKSAQVPIDATLDLHGLHVDQARDAVDAFVRDRRTRGDRVVVIVHGRGRNSPAGQGVLRGEVTAWLSEGRSSKHVAAFVTAPAEHGGEGALCVLLAGPDDRPVRL